MHLPKVKTFATSRLFSLNAVFIRENIAPPVSPVSTPNQPLFHRRSCAAGYFLTKLFHPNVSSEGEICVNVLKRDWTPDVGLRHVLTVIRCLMIEPNPESALNEEAGKLLLESFADFAKKARLLTEIHARKPTILTATGGANALNAESGADGRSANGATQAKHKLAGRPAGVDRKKSLRRL